MEDTDKKLIDEVEEAYKEAATADQTLKEYMKEDFRFYLSDQWDADKKNIVENMGARALVLNYIKKTVDVVTGHERQNRGMLKAFPIEGSDELISEVFSRLIAWALRNKEFATSQAFKDGVIGGVGWAQLYMDYDRDPVNGDICLKHISPFDMTIDPNYTEPDLSDCRYIIHHRRVQKELLKSLYPEKKNVIESCEGSRNTDPYREEEQFPEDRGKTLLVKEYWHREWETRYFKTIQDDQGVSVVMLDEGQDTSGAIKRRIPVIKLRIVVEGKIMVYDGYSPYGVESYPFFPMWCFFNPSYPYMHYKVQGIVRPLKDPQREKNIRRTSMLIKINKQLKDGFIFDKGAVDDKNQLINPKYGMLIEKNPGKEMQPITQPVIDQGLLVLEQQFDADMRTIATNPDLLGEVQAKGDPGVAIQLRQRQGLMSLQEVFDNRAFFMRMIGRRCIELICQNFDANKVKRILGEDYMFDTNRKKLQGMIEQMNQQMSSLVLMESPDSDAQARQIESQMTTLKWQLSELNKKEIEFWQRFENARKTSKFDCVIDETESSQTVRTANLIELRQLAQYQIPVPPEMFMELMPLPLTLKNKWREFMQQQQQAAAQEKEREFQLELAKINKQKEIELVKLYNQKEIELIKQNIDPAKYREIMSQPPAMPQVPVDNQEKM